VDVKIQRDSMDTRDPKRSFVVGLSCILIFLDSGGSMADSAQVVRFADGEGYERFMGRWSRVAGRLFLDWLSLPSGLKWLDVGCGTSAFTEIIRESSGASEIIAIDPSTSQISYAQSRKGAEGIHFQVADARSMPFDDERFDVAASALVLNFIPDREKAVSEMRRVVRRGGTAAAYVWDFANRRGTSQHLHSAVSELEGRGIPPCGTQCRKHNTGESKGAVRSSRFDRCGYPFIRSLSDTPRL
jgi:ubiquinone/menaquinone biosynthesis C-methylase UbiE